MITEYADFQPLQYSRHRIENLAMTGSFGKHVYQTHIVNTLNGHGKGSIRMGTITITVPDELKAEMKKLKRINWSSVARKAFEEAISREEMKEAANGIERLRSSGKARGWSGAREIRKWRDAKSS